MLAMARTPKSMVKGRDSQNGSVGETKIAKCKMRAGRRIQVDICIALCGDWNPLVLIVVCIYIL